MFASAYLAVTSTCLRMNSSTRATAPPCRKFSLFDHRIRPGLVSTAFLYAAVHSSRSMEVLLPKESCGEKISPSRNSVSAKMSSHIFPVWAAVPAMVGLQKELMSIGIPGVIAE